MNTGRCSLRAMTRRKKNRDRGLTPPVDVLSCPECGGRFEARPVIEKILRHLDLPTDPPALTPARVASYLPGFD